MNNLIRSILKTAVYFLDQTNSFTSDMRDRVPMAWAGYPIGFRICVTRRQICILATITPCAMFLLL